MNEPVPPISFGDALIAHTIERIERCIDKIKAARLHLERTGEIPLFFLPPRVPEGVLLTLPPPQHQEPEVPHLDWSDHRDATSHSREPVSCLPLSKWTNLVRHTHHALSHCLHQSIVASTPSIDG